MELMSREEKLLSRTFTKRIAEVTGFITANKSEDLQEKYRKEINDIKRLYKKVTGKPL
jgi:endonuclease III-like uncharacterized protein